MTNLKKKSCFKFLPPIGSSETEARQFKHKLQRGDSCRHTSVNTLKTILMTDLLLMFSL